jgi:predicted ribosomally synthesized peptide with SipW-like signal peptide
MTDQFELSRRQVLGGLALIGIASAGAGASTMAAFSDTESSRGNSIYAGRLDLRIDGDDENVVLLDVDGAVPGDSGRGRVDLKNADGSSVAGAVDVRITGVRNTENGREEMEREGGDTSGGVGELGEHLLVRAYFEDDAGARTYLGDDVYRPANDRFSAGKLFDVHYPLPVGHLVSFVVEWQLPASAPTTIQTDGFEVDFAFEMLQATAGAYIDGGANAFSSTNPRYAGFPAWTGSKAFDAKVIAGNVGNFTLDVGDVTASPGLGLTESFVFTYDGDTTATISAGGTTITDASVAQTNSGVLAIVAKGTGGETATVSNLAIDGIPAAPGAVTADGDVTKGIEFDLGGFAGGVEVTGDVTLSSLVNTEFGLQIDVK